MKKLEYITTLRALAILLVVMVHIGIVSNGVSYLHPFITSIITNGARGVQLFYILSAFTLFLSFHHRNKEKRPITNYFIRRFFRIAPLFYVAIIYYLWQNGIGPRYWLGDATHISTENIVSTATFLNGFNPYWINSIVPGGGSVAIEVVFYCLLPFLFHRIKNIQQACGFTLFTLCLRFILNFFLAHHVLITDGRLWNEYLFLYLPNQLPVFSLGIVLYFLIYDNTAIKFSYKFLFTSSTVILLGLAIAAPAFIDGIFYFGIVFLIFAYALSRYHPRTLFNPVLLYIGKISYTIYLTHWAAIYLLTKYKILNLILSHNEVTAILNFATNYVMVLSLSIGLSTVLYYTIESPMQNVGKRLIIK